MKNFSVSIGSVVNADEENVEAFIVNCTIIPKTPGDVMFKNGMPQLDNYALIPNKLYNELVGIAKGSTGSDPSEIYSYM